MDNTTRHFSGDTMTSPNRQGYNMTKERAGSTGGKKMFSEFGHKLVTFFKETWRSILALCVMGAVTGGVSVSIFKRDTGLTIL